MIRFYAVDKRSSLYPGTQTGRKERDALWDDETFANQIGWWLHGPVNVLNALNCLL